MQLIERPLEQAHQQEAAYAGLELQPDDSARRGVVFRALRRYLRTQFGQPTGWVGWIAGRIMLRTHSNLARIRWTLDVLEVGDRDRVLDIGFGPGVSIELASARACKGFVAGIDHSEVMVRQASRRNAVAIKNGRVVLRVGSAAAVPEFPELFDKILSVNSIHFWPNPVECLARMRGRLKPGGRIAITLQPRTRGVTEAAVRQIGAELAVKLERAGYANCRLAVLNLRPTLAVCATGTNEG